VDIIFGSTAFLFFKNMNTGLKILFMFSFVSGVLCAQVEETYQRQLSDSSYRYQGIIPPVEFQYDMNQIFSKPISNQIPEDVLFDDNPSTVWLRTQLLISNNVAQSGNGEITTHFTSPLYQQYLRDSEFDMFRYVLGIAQASAVGYMAYRHIKKYGFWK
jgi:hypothetical protein